MRRIVKRKILVYLALYRWSRLTKASSRKYWVHPINQLRKKHGEYFTIVKSIESYPLKYFQFFRMSKDKFDYLLTMVKCDISPKANNFRKDTITAKEKLVLTLRFLATGASFSDLSLRFCMGISTVRKCVMTTIGFLAKRLSPLVLEKPDVEKWKEIAKQFHTKWNFPNCLGAVDGKHVVSFAPKNPGSLYFNYKKSFSTVLMAVVDADYKFVMVDIGAYGSNSDCTIFGNSEFGKKWLCSPHQLEVPADSPLPGTSEPLLFVLVGDEAFGLKRNLLTPYPGVNLSPLQAIFNYRLSRARRLVESAFGILAHTWRILLKRIEVDPSQINIIILCCCALQNFLRCNLEENATSNRTEEIIASGTSSSPSEAVSIRNAFAQWCTSEGDVHFQHEIVNRR